MNGNCERPAKIIALMVVSCVVMLTAAAQTGALETGRIIFSSNASGNWDLWSVMPDGKGLRNITVSPENEHSPAVSPDGNEVLYVNAKRGISIMDSDGKNRRELPLPKGIYAQPVWSPDGAGIAFVKYKVVPSDESEIWTMRRRNGKWTDIERLTQFPPMRLYPAFSPNGKLLAYTEFRRDPVKGVVEEIGVMDLGKKTYRKITDAGTDSFRPVWSPDGRKIAYTSSKSGNYDVWVLSPDDGSEIQLTRNASYDGEPAWSPDGNEIAFVSADGAAREIWITSATGDRLRQVTRTGMSCKDPVWVR